MSEDTPTEFAELYKKNFRSENDLSGEVAMRINKILESMDDFDEIEKDKFNPIMLSVIKESESGKLTLVVDEFGAVFLGAMSRAILEALTGQLEGLLQSGAADTLIKKKINEVFSDMVKFATAQQTPDGNTWIECRNCQKVTPASGKHCMNCGITIK